MSKSGSEHRQGASSSAPEEVLVVCRLFNDLITERLCSLRRQELSAAWECTCDTAGGSAARVLPGVGQHGRVGKTAQDGKSGVGAGGKAAA